MVADIREGAAQPRYDLTRIAIQACGEALRRPPLEERARSYYKGVRGQLVELAGRWREEGQVPPEADDDAIATVLITLIPGLLVGQHLVAEVSADDLTGGISALGSASRKA